MTGGRSHKGKTKREERKGTGKKRRMNMRDSDTRSRKF